MMEAGDLIWIQRAAFEYNRSRDWLDEQIKLGKLRRITIPGDRKTYLSRKEIETLLTPQVDGENR